MKKAECGVVRLLKIITLCACVVLLPAVAQATILYNVVSDFSTNSNPNGVWSYLADRSLAAGGQHDGSYSLMTGLVGGGAVGWSQDGGFNGARILLTDAVGGNYWNAARTNLAMIASSSVPDGYRWQSSIVAWTAWRDGWVDVNYLINNTGPANAVNIALDQYDGATRTDLVPLFSLAASSSTNLVISSLWVNSGDQIQFWRDSYTDQQGNIIFGADSYLSFSPIPEPGTVMLLALGGGILAWARRRRG